MIVRVVPDVTGLAKAFDYTVPEELVEAISIGTQVRVDLHGRRVGGWVTEVDPTHAFTGEGLQPVRSVSALGPDEQLVDLGRWAAIRWVGRLRAFLKIASPERAIKRAPAPARTAAELEPVSPATRELLSEGGGVLVLPPSADPMPSIYAAMRLGPVLIIEPSADRGRLLAARLRRSGATVALMPGDWAAARGGVDVVIGARTAAWAPCPGLSVAIVLDEHDESLQSESSPTWHARDVMIERCRRSDVPLLLVSPAPTLTAIEWAATNVARPSTARTRRGWPIVDVIDRSDTEPWKRSLLSSQLIQQLRDPDRTVVCVSNTPGRARLMACRNCRELARCERCDASVELDSDSRLACRRCGTVRPAVCLNCQHSTFANLRPGVAQLRIEIEAAAARPVELVHGTDSVRPPQAGVYVGTEAVLHRVERADTVAFLEFDRELLAPRFRANEQAMALLVRAARLLGPRDRGGRLMIQTFMARNVVVQAALHADFARLVDAEREQRKLLRLPPYAALAEVSGAGSDEFVESLPPDPEIQSVTTDGGYAVRAPDWDRLGAYLLQGQRPSGARLRIAVDPPR